MATSTDMSTNDRTSTTGTRMPPGRQLFEDMQAEIARLRTGLLEVRAFLEKPEWGTSKYMEGSEVYDDKDTALFKIRYALGEVT